MTQDVGATANEATVEWLMKPGAPDVATSVGELFRRPAWMDNAACRGEPVGTFFPERGQSVQRVRELCGGCPVRSECLNYAIEDRDTAGWWGGTSERARRNIHRTEGTRSLWAAEGPAQASEAPLRYRCSAGARSVPPATEGDS